MVPLFPHLAPGTKYIEPCAAAGQMVEHLKKHGHECVYACDIEPGAAWVEKRDVLFFARPFPKADKIITNPPWKREILHPMIKIFTAQADTWLLFDTDWASTVQAKPFKAITKKIVAVGRVKWIPGSRDQGKENCSWYLFSHNHDLYGEETRFYFR